MRHSDCNPDARCRSGVCVVPDLSGHAGVAGIAANYANAGGDLVGGARFLSTGGQGGFASTMGVAGASAGAVVEVAGARTDS